MYPYVSFTYSYVTCKYPYVLVCFSYVTRMLLVCYPYVTRMYSYVSRMLLVCYSYVSRVYSYAVTRTLLECHPCCVLAAIPRDRSLGSVKKKSCIVLTSLEQL